MSLKKTELVKRDNPDQVLQVLVNGEELRVVMQHPKNQDEAVLILEALAHAASTAARALVISGMQSCGHTRCAAGAVAEAVTYGLRQVVAESGEPENPGVNLH